MRRATLLTILQYFCYRISIHALREESDKRYNTNVPISNKFQSTLSVRRAIWKSKTVVKKSLYISIHALREESDICWLRNICGWNDFNPRSPWGERPFFHKLSAFYLIFQSTLSVRRATWTVAPVNVTAFYFNPRSPWGERQCGRAQCVSCTQFQSTLSVRRATE